MRVKLRPGAHFVPAATGTYCAHRGRSFLLAGPPALFRLIDSRLAELTDGTTVDELARAAGGPAAAPALEQLVRVLLDMDVLFDVDAAGSPVPDAATAARYVDVLSYLEEHCPRPYTTFAALRAATVQVEGAGPAVAALLRGLHANGMRRHDPTTAGPPSLAILVDDADAPLDLLHAAARLRPDTPVVPVLTRVDITLVGPVGVGCAPLAAFLATARRAAEWQRATPAGPPRPVAPVLAGSLAAHRALQRVAGTADERDAVVVHGPAVSTSRIAVAAPDIAPAAAAPRQPLDTAQLAETAAAAGEPEFPAGVEVLTAPWRGLARVVPEPGLPPGPLALARLDPLWRPDPVISWGESAEAASHSALLDLLRARVRDTAPDEDASTSAAAGTTADRWVADGLLRIVGTRSSADAPGQELTWGELSASPARAMWTAIDSYFGQPVRLHIREVAGLDWILVGATDSATGAVLAAEWAPGAAYGAHLALSSVLALVQRGRKAVDTGPAAPVGTRCLEMLPGHAIAECLRRLRSAPALSGRRVVGHRLVDPVLGELPVPCGQIRLERD